MNLKKRCCCPGESGEFARFVEVEPVINIPSSSYMYSDIKFFIDLRGDEPLTDDLLLYEGGPASTAEIPIRFGYLEEFVPSRVTRIRYSDGERGIGNLNDILGIKHRGYRIKSGGLVFTTSEYLGSDFPAMTRIELGLPNSISTDKIQQVQLGGFYFLGGQFFETPALVQTREGLNQNGNPTSYLVGYNPRRECSRPEQARTYNPNRLVFDFTTEFPDEVTLEYRYVGKFENVPGFGDVSFDETITRTYFKFVAGGNTFPTTSELPAPGNTFPSTFLKVTGFEVESPEESQTLLFGYKATSCTEALPIPSRSILGANDFTIFSVPSMPIKAYCAGNGNFGGGLSAGDPATNLAFGDNQGDNDPPFKFLPHMDPDRVGVILGDVTVGPDNPQLDEDQTVRTFQTQFGSSAPLPNRGGAPFTAMSYKGDVAIENFHTCSLEEPYKFLARRRRSAFPFPKLLSGVTIREDGIDPRVADQSFGTGDFPIVRLDSRNGDVALERMTNPLGGAYHYLTDGLSAGSFFNSNVFPKSVTMS